MLHLGPENADPNRKMGFELCVVLDQSVLELTARNVVCVSAKSVRDDRIDEYFKFGIP